MLIPPKWWLAAGSGTLMGYFAATSVYEQVRRHGSLAGLSIPWQEANEAGWIAGILVALIVFWLVIWIAAKMAQAQANLDMTLATEPARLAGPTYPPGRGRTVVPGILAGVISALVIGVLALFGPALVKPEYGMIWFWFSWAIAPVAGIFGGAIIGGLVHRATKRRAEVDERSEKRPPDLRDL